jgi:hypothetical protein
VFVVQEQGATQVIHPLVIKGYDTSVEAPTTATYGEEIAVNVTADPIEENITHDRIEVVIAGQNQQIRETAVKMDDTYTAIIDTRDLTPGVYDVYANVRGKKIVFDEQVIFGISDARTLTVESTTSTSDSPGTTAQQSPPETDTTDVPSDPESETAETVLTPADQSQPTTATKIPGFSLITMSVTTVILLLLVRSAQFR